MSRKKQSPFTPRAFHLSFPLPGCFPRSPSPKCHHGYDRSRSAHETVSSHYVLWVLRWEIGAVFTTNIADIRKVNGSDAAAFQEAKISLQQEQTSPRTPGCGFPREVLEGANPCQAMECLRILSRIPQVFRRAETLCAYRIRCQLRSALITSSGRESNHCRRRMGRPGASATSDRRYQCWLRLKVQLLHVFFFFVFFLRCDRLSFSDWCIRQLGPSMLMMME